MRTEFRHSLWRSKKNVLLEDHLFRLSDFHEIQCRRSLPKVVENVSFTKICEFHENVCFTKMWVSRKCVGFTKICEFHENMCFRKMCEFHENVWVSRNCVSFMKLCEFHENVWVSRKCVSFTKIDPVTVITYLGRSEIYNQTSYTSRPIWLQFGTWDIHEKFIALCLESKWFSTLTFHISFLICVH
jgi:hypothetical protein